MPPRPATATLDSDHRRLLDLLAGSRDGTCPEALLLAAHGVSADTIEALRNAGHVEITTTNMRAGGKVVPVRRVVITAAGRVAVGQ